MWFFCQKKNINQKTIHLCDNLFEESIFEETKSLDKEKKNNANPKYLVRKGESKSVVEGRKMLFSPAQKRAISHPTAIISETSEHTDQIHFSTLL